MIKLLVPKQTPNNILYSNKSWQNLYTGNICWLKKFLGSCYYAIYEDFFTEYDRKDWTPRDRNLYTKCRIIHWMIYFYFIFNSFYPVNVFTETNNYSSLYLYPASMYIPNYIWNRIKLLTVYTGRCEDNGIVCVRNYQFSNPPIRYKYNFQQRSVQTNSLETTCITKCVIISAITFRRVVTKVRYSVFQPLVFIIHMDGK